MDEAKPQDGLCEGHGNYVGSRNDHDIQSHAAPWHEMVACRICANPLGLADQ